MMMKIFYLLIATDHSAQTIPCCLSNLLTTVEPNIVATLLIYGHLIIHHPVCARQ